VTLDLESIDTTITDGDTVVLNQFLPEMKGSEFLMSAIKHANLYITDPNEDNEVDIVSLPDYYQDTTEFEDITQIVDHKKEILTTPIANKYKKTHNFTFKDGKDQDMIDYFDKWGEKYGDHSFENQSTFAKGKQEYKLNYGTIIPYEISPGILVPRFIKINNGVVKPNKGAPRVMMWNGLKTGNWILTDALAPANQTAHATYPSLHHFDDWEDPDFDLNFKLVIELYYIATVATTTNSFSEWYFEFINEMTSSAGKLLEVYLKLTKSMVKTPQFNLLRMWNGALFRLNIIDDFDDEIQETTKVELIKVLEARNPNRTKPTIPSLPPILTENDPITNPGGGQAPGGEGVLIGGLTGSALVTSGIIRG